MILHIPNLLRPDQVHRCGEILAAASWVDGRITAGPQSGLAKHNLQLPEGVSESKELGEMVLKALAANPLFMSAALPLKVYPPLFNRYTKGMGFADHVDNAIRTSPVTGMRYRTDLSATLFLAAPDGYDGGELVIGAGLSPARVKLQAGDMVLYPANTIHRVEPVTRGERLACIFWIESMIADDGQRSLLHQLDQAISSARAKLGDADPTAIALVSLYHNLVRMWATL